MIFLILIWILLFAASLSLLEFLLTFLRSSQGSSILSLDWAGYVVTAGSESEVTGVSASWTVPSVAASAVDSFSAAWIGIGGLGDQTLIQTGTEHDFINSQAVYSVWYEMLPADLITINTINVSVGDVISASLSLLNSNTNEWSIQMYDITNGQGFNQNFVYNSSRLTAEWIVERPTVNNKLSTLADFGSITFTNTNVMVDSSSWSIRSHTFSRVVMSNRQNVELTSVSGVTANGSDFTVTYTAVG